MGSSASYEIHKIIHNYQDLETTKMYISRQMDNLWYKQAVKYTVLKELSSHDKTWKKLKCTLLSERIQSERTTYHMILSL
jgi:hypothetical protein